MSRNLTTALATALATSSVRPAIFVSLEFASGAVYFWSGKGDNTYDSNTYTGLGDLTGLDMPEETSNGSTNGMSLSLSGIPSVNVALALEEYQNRPATVLFAALDSSDAIIADPYQIFSGLIDVISIEDDGDSSSITVNLEGYAYGVGPSMDRYTNEAQKRVYATDTSLRFIKSLSEKQVYWGVGAAESATTTTPPNGQYLTGNMDGAGYIDRDGDGEYDDYLG